MKKRPVRKRSGPKAGQADLGYYPALIASLPEAVLVCDHLGRLIEVNLRASELLGFAREELLGRSIATLAPGSGSPPAQPAAPAGLPTGEVLLKGKDGSLRPVAISMRPLPGDRRVFSLRDIRLQKETEAALHRKTAELEQYFENSLDLLCIANTAGQFVRLNPEWEKVLGYPLAELQGRSFLELVHPDDQASTLAVIARLSAQQEVLHFTNRYRCKDGTDRWIEWNAHPAGDLIHAVARDITGRKQAGAALRHANRQLRMLNECNEALLHHSDETGLLTTVCRIAVVTGGYRMAWVGFAENDPARTVRPVAWTGAEEGYLGVANVSWGESERGGGPIGIAIRSGRPCAIQDLLADPRCAPWWPEIRRHGYAASCALPLILDGRTLGALTIIASTTGAFDEKETALLARLANNVAFGIGARRARAEHERVEQALADETAWRRILVEQSRDGIVVLDGDGRVFEANRRFAETLGYSPGEISALHVWDWDAQWTRAQLLEIIERQDQKGTLFSTRHRRKDGSVFDVEVSSNGTVIGGRKFVFCVIRDITERKQAEEVLRRTQWSIDRARDAVYWIDHTGRFFYVNEAACRELGYTRDELVRMTVMDIDPGFPASRWPDQWAKTRRLRAYTIETTHRAKDGHTIPVEVAINHMQFEGQEFHCAFARDISERKRAEAAGRASERRFRQMFEDTRAIMLLLDPDSGAIVEANPAAAEFYGYAREALRRMRIEDLTTLPPEQVKARRAEVREGRNLSFVVSHRLASGELRSVEVRSSAVEIDGRLLLFAIIQDITERKRAEQAERQINRHLLMLSECNEAVIRSSDEASLLQTVCRLMVENGGYRGAWIGFAENDEGKTVRPVAWAGLDQDYVAGLRVSWADNEHGQGPAAIAIRTGRPCPMQGVLDDPRFAPWQDEASKRGIAAICALPLAAHDRVFGVLCIDAAQPAAFDAAETAILQEVAGNLAFGMAVLQTRLERQRAELALREAEALYRTVFQTAPDGMTLLDLEGRITFVSPMALEVYGLADPSAAVGRHFSDFIAPADRAQAQAKFSTALANEFGHALQYTLLRGDGATFVGEIKGALLRGATGRPRGVLIITRDITERKRTEDMLLRVNKAVECASDAIGMADAQGRHFYQNKAFTDLFEYTTEEVSASGGEPAGYVDKNAAREVFATIMNGGSWSGEVKMKSKSGREFPVWLRADAIEDESGKVIGLVGVHTDITERKHAEQERLDLERRLLHTQKLESLGVLAGGIAHDFNNLLMAILGNLDLALMDISPLSPARASLEQGVNAARRAADLTRQMLAYSGRGSFDIRSLDLCELVTENAHLFRASISKLVTLQVENAKELPCIMADAGQIQQVVMNLITNASEAIGNHPGIVRLRTDVMDCDAATLQRNRGDVVPAPGRFVLLEVTDTGCGMDESTLQRLFEPFFTTKFTGRGLGMSALLGIVRGHQGAIFVDSVVGRGTTIQVLFPVDPASGEAGPVRARQQASGGMPAGDRMGTVLVVDDEVVVRQVCKQMLVRRGWKVIEAADGPEAVGLFQQQPDEIALVVLDLSMPKMSGIEVFRTLRALRPNVRIILTSGYSSDQSSSAELAAEGLAGFIQKPYTVQALFHEVERALKRP